MGKPTRQASGTSTLDGGKVTPTGDPMTTRPKEKLFSHGNTKEDWDLAHEELVAGEIWKSLAFRGVLVDPVKAAVFVQLGCPACDTTISMSTDIFTAMEAVTNASGICYRSLEALTTAATWRRPRTSDG